MKSLFIVILSTLFFNVCQSQCLLSFNQLDNSRNYSLSEFENFALRNGFTYNSEKKSYLCDIEFAHGWNQQLKRSNGDDNSIIVSYVFFQKKQYIDFKMILESQGKLIESNNDNNNLIFTYLYNNRLISLHTKTYNSQTFYLILF
jgi:hypothetical protein